MNVTTTRTVTTKVRYKFTLNPGETIEVSRGSGRGRTQLIRVHQVVVQYARVDGAAELPGFAQAGEWRREVRWWGQNVLKDGSMGAEVTSGPFGSHPEPGSALAQFVDTHTSTPDA